MLMLTVRWVGVWVGERDQQQGKACDWWRTSTSTSLFKLLFSTSRKQENIACNISDFFLQEKIRKTHLELHNFPVSVFWAK